MFKVSNFLSHFDKHKDFARTSRFEVRIAPPPVLSTSETYELRFQCESSELPAYGVNVVENRQYGVGSPVASTPTAFSDITLTFICAGDMWEKKLFDRWMNAVIPINNYNPRYKESYTTSKIEIFQFSGVSTVNNPEQSERAYVVSLINAFPVSMGALTLNWGDDGVHRLPITFKYDYWTTVELEKYAIPSTDPQDEPRQDYTGVPTASGSAPVVSPTSPFTGGRGGQFSGGGASGGW